MKRVTSMALFVTLAVVLLLLSATLFYGCDDTTLVVTPAGKGEAEVLAFQGGTIEGNKLYYEVSEEVDSVDLGAALTVTKGCLWALNRSDEDRTLVEGGVATDLKDGENLYYLTVSAAGGEARVYELTLFRNYYAPVSYYLFGEPYKTDVALTHTYLSNTPTPTCDGYSFVGWSTEKVYVTGPVHLDAILSANNYTVTLDSVGGDQGVTTQEVTFGKSYSLGVPSRAGYVFAGWYQDASARTDFAGRSLSVWSAADGATFSAKWMSESLSAAGGEKTPYPGYWGSYPQVLETNSTYIARCKTAAGALPTPSDSKSWTPYEYYSGGSRSNYMWYIDVTILLTTSPTRTYGTYRGVYFTSYRPNDTAGKGKEATSCQDDNGYTPSTAYWFRYDTIIWRIHLTSSDSTYNYFFMSSEAIIDAQPFYRDAEPHSSGGNSYFANNYRGSDIRSWLNNYFYNTAITDKTNTLTVKQARDKGFYTINTAQDSANPSLLPGLWNGGVNNYCEATNSALNSDKLFLLSTQDVTKTWNEGLSPFDTDVSALDSMRRHKPTDYALAQGAFKSKESGYTGCGSWWLRSPNFALSMEAQFVGAKGDAKYVAMVNAINGVVPGICVRVKK